MQKIISNVTNNNFNFLGKKCGLSKSQNKNLKKLGGEILKKGSLILRHLLPENSENTAKEQGKIWGNLLETINIETFVQEKIFTQFCREVKEDTVIAYDLTDEIHPYAKTPENPSKRNKGMENISQIFDGSKRKRETGFFLHGVGTNKFLLRLDPHQTGYEFLPQRRKTILEEMLPKLEGKGIWAFDRGNDDEKLFSFLNKKEIKFVVRLKKKRIICICETGEITNTEDLPEGRYEVYVKKSGGFKKGKTDKNGFDTKNKYFFIKKKEKKTKNSKEIFLLCSINLEKFSDAELVQKYLERWGVETQFRKVKQMYNLEKTQIRNWKRKKNLLALLLFVHFLNTQIRSKLEEAKEKLEKWALETWEQLKFFLEKQSKTYNPYSFTAFLRTQIPKNFFFYLRVKPLNPTSKTAIPLFEC